MSILMITINILAVFITLSFHSLHICLAADSRLKSNCSSSSYEPNSPYEKNLNILLSSLAENANQNKNQLYNASFVPDGNSTVFGLFLCTGDDTRGDCQECVANATKRIVKDCRTHRPIVATIWYDDCMVRYSNESIFGVMAQSPKLYMTNHENMTSIDAPRFSQVVGKFLQQLAEKAANSPTKYANNETAFNSFINVFAAAQCTPDISIHECLNCLTLAIVDLPACCNSSKDARVLTPSCNIRYAPDRFYQTQTPPLSPPLSAPVINNTATSGKRKAPNFAEIAIVVLAATVVVLVFICIVLIWKRRNRFDNAGEGVERRNPIAIDPLDHDNGTSDMLIAESLTYDWATLRDATNGFTAENKLGQGGFGSVYKGTLTNGQEIAVKRLSNGSSQGAQQFKNEVVLVARLQHRNLVKLLGFCVAGYEKLLVYEFVPNRSLDLFLFDPVKRHQLDWPTRYKIIKGIARGMLYLHEDSRLRIVHRDLKASNILLDIDMNPKISDFGTARNFNLDESEANTSKIAGTFGYMAPEYLLHGEFSMKSDVYSFGVLLLEIITGKKSTSFRWSETANHISTYAWNSWKAGNPLEIVDPCLGDSCSNDEVKRCIQIGLLCVQGDTEKRPTMSSVVYNLNSSSDLPMPLEPTLLSNNNCHCQTTVRSLTCEQEPRLAKSSSNSSELSFGADISIS